jgi:hypothetical protein
VRSLCPHVSRANAGRLVPPLHAEVTILVEVESRVSDNPALSGSLGLKPRRAFELAVLTYDLDIKPLAVRPLNDRVGRHAKNMTMVNQATQHRQPNFSLVLCLF